MVNTIFIIIITTSTSPHNWPVYIGLGVFARRTTLGLRNGKEANLYRDVDLDEDSAVDAQEERKERTLAMREGRRWSAISAVPGELGQDRLGYSCGLTTVGALWCHHRLSLIFSFLRCSYVVNDGTASPLSNISQPGMSGSVSVLLSFYMSMHYCMCQCSWSPGHMAKSLQLPSSGNFNQGFILSNEAFNSLHYCFIGDFLLPGDSQDS